MKITEVRTHVAQATLERSWLFVEVETDEDISGFGEASQSRNDAGVIAEIERLAPAYIGQNPLDFIERSLAPLTWPYVGRTLFAAISALEQALWDLCGKKLGVPVYQLFGGRVRDRVRAYANIGYATRDDSAEALAEAARGAVRDGFDAVKCYPFGMRRSIGPDAPSDRSWIAAGIERVRAVREAVGPNVDVLVDLMHQLVDAVEARSVAQRLEPFDLFWIEDPFVRDDPSELAELRGRIGTRLAGGAPHLRCDDFRPLLEHRSLDVIMPDVKWLGGIGEAKKIASAAQMYGILASPHNASGPVATAAALHLAFSLPNFLILEYAWGVPSWRGALSRGTESLHNGGFAVPDAPGLGVEFDVSVAAASRTATDAQGTVAGVALPAH